MLAQQPFVRVLTLAGTKGGNVRGEREGQSRWCLNCCHYLGLALEDQQSQMMRKIARQNCDQRRLSVSNISWCMHTCAQYRCLQCNVCHQYILAAPEIEKLYEIKNIYSNFQRKKTLKSLQEHQVILLLVKKFTLLCIYLLFTAWIPLKNHPHIFEIEGWIDTGISINFSHIG